MGPRQAQSSRNLSPTHITCSRRLNHNVSGQRIVQPMLQCFQLMYVGRLDAKATDSELIASAASELHFLWYTLLRNHPNIELIMGVS